MSEADGRAAVTGKEDRTDVTFVRRTGILLAVAITVWFVSAIGRSFWCDEFHSMHHVLTEDLHTFLESVREDNHPPLGFLLERLSVGVFGLSHFSLRLPSILIGIAYLVLLARFCRRLPDPTARKLAPWLVLASPYLLVVFTEARMYSLLALAVLGLMSLLVGVLEDSHHEEARPSPRWMTLWVAVGLHAHYYFVHVLALAAVLTFVAIRLTPGSGKRARDLVIPAVLGILLWAPWGFYGFLSQLTHDLPPGGDEGTLAMLVQSIAHFFFWNASVGGDWLVYGIAWPGCLLAAIALVLGTWRYLAAAWRNASLRVSLLMVTGFGFGFPLWCYLASIVFSRSRFGWRYVAGAAGPVLVLAAIGLARRGITTRVLGVLLVATMTTVMLVNVFAGGREDYARLVSYVLENAREGDAVLQEPLWELDPSRGETPWRYYLERTNLPANAPVPDELVYSQHDDALRYERVWMWARDPYSPWVQESLQRHFPDESTWRMGPGLTLYLFSGPPKDE